MKKMLLLLPLAATLLLAQSCKKDVLATNNYTDTVDCSGLTPTYETNVKSIINNSCASSGCHSASSRAAGIQLADFANTKDEFINGRALCSIYHDCNPMPRNAAKLSDATIRTLTCWVKDGCPQ